MSSTGGVVPTSAPSAPVGRRVAAYLVDSALTLVVATPLWLATLLPVAAAARAASAAGPGTVAEPAAPSGLLLALGAVLVAAWGIAQWVWNGTRGWTVGRRLLGLRLVDVRSGRPVGMGRAFVRALIVALGALACGVGQLVVLLSPLFDSSGRRRGWHDRVGEAVVVDVRGLAAARRVEDWSARPDAARADRGAVASATAGADRAPDEAPAWTGVPHPATAGDAADVPSVDPTPSEPTRTRWSAMAADRRLDAPGLVLPPLGAPGLGPDLDTRQIPVVPAAVVPAHPAAPVPLAPGPESAVPAAGPAAPAPEPPAAPWVAAGPVPSVPWPAPDRAPASPAPWSGHAPGEGPAWPPLDPAPAAEPASARAPEAGAWPPPAPAPAPAPWAPPTPAEHPAPAAPSGEGSAWRDALGPVPGAEGEPPTRTGRHAIVPAAPVHPDAPAAAAPAPVAPAPAAPAAHPMTSAPTPPPAPPAPAADPLPPHPFPGPAAAPADPDAAWAVRLPDGTVAGLAAPLLVGRNPDPQPGVRTVSVADPGRSVSKTHLMLGVDEHGPWVVDRGSTNGTLVTLADGQRIVCLPDRRVRLADGSLVTFGDLSLAVGLRA